MSACALRIQVSKNEILDPKMDPTESNQKGTKNETKGANGTQKEANREIKMDVETTIGPAKKYRFAKPQKARQDDSMYFGPLNPQHAKSYFGKTNSFLKSSFRNK